VTPAALATHGVGGSTDLPIPFIYAMVGASWALTISFAVLALAWKEPKFADGPPPRPLPPRRPWLAAVGALLTAWLLVALYAGPTQATNGGVTGFYILVWVGLVPLALLAGHVWRDLSPWRTLQQLVGRVTGRPEGLVAYPRALGYWPAAAGLFAFVWLELASPDPGDVGAVRLWVGAYVLVTMVGGVVFGPTWFDRADPFDVYSAVVARLSPLVRDGRWAPHNPLRTLPDVPVAPGLVAVLATLLGSTAYDSFSASSFWQSRSLSGLQHTLTLLGFCVVVGVLFVAASVATGGVSRERRRQLPGLLAHSLVPIVVGYIFAHYLTYLLEKGQVVVLALLDPLGRGWEPLGDPATAYFLSQSPSVLAALKVSCVVAGHVVAVVAAHDRALALLPAAHRLSGQLAMLVLMVAYTFTGLYLLFSV
jgi:cation transporter-like permease